MALHAIDLSVNAVAHPHEGILVVDKPVGPTSFDVVHKLRRAMGTREMGHCGTLDPLASGVIVVCVGRYTRLVRFLTADDKRYRARITIGSSTPSLDLETGVDVVTGVDGIDETRVHAALGLLQQQTSQVPPLHSAVQRDGVRLYEKARRGEVFEVPPRDVVVRSLRLQTMSRRSEPTMGVDVIDLDVDVDVGKGYFVRALARDLGQSLGCAAHLSGLRRTHSGLYTLEDAVPLDVARDPAQGPQALRRGPAAVRGMPIVALDQDIARALRCGQRPPSTAAFVGEALGICDDELVAVVAHVDGHLRSVRGF